MQVRVFQEVVEFFCLPVAQQKSINAALIIHFQNINGADTADPLTDVKSTDPFLVFFFLH